MGWIPSGGGTSLTVAEADGAPSVSGVSTILVSNTTLTDNTGGSVTIAMTPAGGANTALSNLAAVAINTALLSAPGIAAALTATGSAAGASSKAGIPVTLTASAATAGITSAGAAAGGDITITSGDAARKTSGDANGGNIILVPGVGIGTGSYGIARPSADNILALGSSAYRLTTVSASTGLSIYKAASEANPTATLGDGVLNFGAGTSNAVDVGLKRSSGGVLYVTDGSSGQGDLNAHGLVITDTTTVTNLNADTVDGSHAAAFANVALSNLASVAINAPLVTGVGTALTLEAAAPITDAAPSTSLLKGADAFPGAATNTTGANTILSGGIGKRIFTVVDYTQLAGTTVTITVNGTATVKTENVDWFDTTSNGAVAISLAAAIDAIAGVTASAATNDVRIVPDVGTYSLIIAKTAADAGMTATSGTDGQIILGNEYNLAGLAPYSNVGIRVTNGTTGYAGVEANYLTIRAGQEIKDSGYTFAIGTSTVALKGTMSITFSSGSTYYSGIDSGIARSDVGLLKITDGSTGNGSIIASTAITAVGTAAANGYIRTGVYKRAWTNAEVVALDPTGVLLTADFLVATLPAKTIVRNAYVVIDSQAAGLDTATVALGRTGATYIDYIVASNAMVAANTVYGDAVAERGTNLTGYDLPSYTATTGVYLHFIVTDGGADTLHDITSCTGTVYLMTEVLP